MTTRSKEWNEGYETGYKDGESSASADWFLALGEEFDMPDLKGPEDFIQRMKGEEGKRWARS